MASTRELRRRIRSVGNTSQITNAMQMVAASKMRKAQQAALATRPFVRLLYRIQRAATEGVNFIILNPAAFTHSSVAMRDALAAVGIPFVEVHLSNVFARESFRRESYFTDLAVGIIGGLGAMGYELALAFALQYSRKK